MSFDNIPSMLKDIQNTLESSQVENLLRKLLEIEEKSNLPY